MNLFKRRILGLSSYFRDVESLMPSQQNDNFRIIKIGMSDYQLVSTNKRGNKRELEKNNAKQSETASGRNAGIFEDTVSTYRIFSRAF